jgi:hypothetical protein
MAVAHPSWDRIDLVATFSKIGFPWTGGSWRRSPTNSMFRDPNHSLLPNNSSSLMCTKARLILETIEISSIINNLTSERVALMIFWDVLGSGQ